MGRIFISYSSRNQKIANALCEYLEQLGLRCWIAPRDIPSASNYAGEITRAIKSCERFLLVYSKDACKSEHVKNEINLAINNAKSILPYCLDNSPYDDDLEYYLSTRQKISSCGDQERDFQNLASFLLGREVTAPRTPEPEPVAGKATEAGKPRKAGLFYALGALVVAAFCLWFFLLRPSPTDPGGITDPVDQGIAADTTGHSPDLQKDTVQTQGSPVDKGKGGNTGSQTAKDEPRVKDTSADTFTGTIKNGYPDGYGTYTFRKSRRIDMHDPEARVAQAGDYIVGDWNNGHLNYGEWYGSDGVKKAFIELGDFSDIQQDHVFAKCVKP